MNRGLVATVILFIIIAVMVIAATVEHKSGHRTSCNKPDLKLFVERARTPQPYVAKLNEHDVLLVNDKDTIHLYFTSPYLIEEGSIIFLKHGR